MKDFGGYQAEECLYTRFCICAMGNWGNESYANLTSLINKLSFTLTQSLDGEFSLKRLRSELVGSPTHRQNPKKLLGSRVLCKALAQTRKAVPEGIWTPFKVQIHYNVNKTL